MFTRRFSIFQANRWQWLSLVVLAAVFCYAGVNKLLGVSVFSHIIARFDLLPPAWINPVAIILPVVEILLGLALLLPAWQRPALFGVILCVAMFAAALMSTILRGIPVSCGCFGLSEKPSSYAAWWALGRDSLLFGLAVSQYIRKLRTDNMQN